jgi:tetratricopeptide (TPR) repeat protein
MPEAENRVEELRRLALAKHRSGDLEDALAVYDEALLAGADDEQRELITINKADVLIELQRSGPEVQALPTILMRRRNPHHTFLSSYQMMFKHRVAGEMDRAIFYGQIAHKVAIEAGNGFWKLASLNELGIAYETNSQFSEAIGCFDDALGLLDSIAATEHTISRIAIIQNLAYAKLLVGEIETGLQMIHTVLEEIESSSAKAESLIDLCYGYVELQQYDKALQYGNAGLELAAEPRQIRNAHYLLGEAAYKAGDIETAELHFDELSRFYPQFRNLKALLFAIDLRSMVNLKL